MANTAMGFIMYNVYLCRYKGTWNAFRSIMKSEGITGLWKGWVPNCQRAAIVCLGGTCMCRCTVQLKITCACMHVVGSCQTLR